MRKFFIFMLLVLVSYSPNLRAESNSYYYLNLEVGDNRSKLDNYLHLDYQWQVDDYNILTRWELKKGYDIWNGNWYNEKSFQDDLSFTDYFWDYSNDFLISVNQRRDKLKLGLISTPSISNFIYGTSIVGTYLNWNKYQLWAGKTTGFSSGFSSSSNNYLLGVSHSVGSRKISYQINQKRSIDVEQLDYITYNNHYLAYSDSYSIGKAYLSLDTIVGRNPSDDLTGKAASLNLASDWRRINYNLSAMYESSDFQSIRSRGYGEYNLALLGYRQLGSYLVQGKISYKQDNLDQEIEKVNKDWDSSWKVDYYANDEDTYRVAINYGVNSEYLTTKETKVDQVSTANLKLAYETKWWNYNLDFNRTDEDSATLSISYDPDNNYNLIVNYEVTEKKNNTIERYFDLGLNYQKKLFNKGDYDLDLKLQDRNNLNLNLDQNISYTISKRKELGIRLNLSQSLDIKTPMDKKLICNYRYKF